MPTFRDLRFLRIVTKMRRSTFFAKRIAWLLNSKLTPGFYDRADDSTSNSVDRVQSSSLLEWASEFVPYLAQKRRDPISCATAQKESAF